MTLGCCNVMSQILVNSNSSARARTMCQLMTPTHFQCTLALLSCCTHRATVCCAREWFACAREGKEGRLIMICLGSVGLLEYRSRVNDEKFYGHLIAAKIWEGLMFDVTLAVPNGNSRPRVFIDCCTGARACLVLSICLTLLVSQTATSPVALWGVRSFRAICSMSLWHRAVC